VISPGTREVRAEFDRTRNLVPPDVYRKAPLPSRPGLDLIEYEGVPLNSPDSSGIATDATLTRLRIEPRKLDPAPTLRDLRPSFNPRAG